MVVDDDEDLRAILTEVYQRSGYTVFPAPDGRTALRTLFEERCDLVVLDLGLPGLDGLGVLHRIREMTNVPVLLLTARSRENDKIVGLLAGADDYMTKPFSGKELLARSTALLRRVGETEEVQRRLKDGRVAIDLASREVVVDGHAVTLTPIDWGLLVAFVRHPNVVLSPQQLLDLAWHDPLGIGPDRVKFAIMRLRRRLGWGDTRTSPIVGVRGFGYRYRPATLVGTCAPDHNHESDLRIED